MSAEVEDEVEMVEDEERNEDKEPAPPQMDESIPAVGRFK